MRENITTRIQFFMSCLLLFWFLVLIITPVCVQFFYKGQQQETTENRRLADFPSLGFNPSDLRAFPSGFEAWFQDHYGFRDKVIQIHNAFKFFVLHSNPLPSKVAVGSEPGWLFLGDKLNQHNYQQDIPLEFFPLESIEETTVEFHRWCAERGIFFAQLLIPRKHNVYPEYLPRWFVRRGTCYPLGAYLERMKAHPEIFIMDATPCMLAAKKNHVVFFPADSHWNSQGAYSVCREFLDRLHERIDVLRPIDPERVSWEVKTVRWGIDLARMLNLAPFFYPQECIFHISGPQPRKLTPEQVQREYADLIIPPTVQVEAVYECPGASPLRAVVFCDSFGRGTHDFFPYVFERVVYVRNIYQWPELLLKEKPDVVIWVNVEVVLFRGEVVEAWEEKAAAGKNYAGSRACGP
ncbi:MAG TPA: hypothetical protein PK379_05095 [Candidatus Hydrogenedentes bacterium]|nr:hypothetical protein [Candidatus Hydrogenedentota bacterium]HOK89380.1 hypothetical protein [Candidatus Hydrogenedentota bacterium]HOV59979.1 hypothetical protein [Candidatus Hydrogenedentota bacterium]